MSANRQPPRPRPLLNQITLPWAVAIAAVIACIALGFWALALRDDLHETEDRIAALVRERDELRRSATATVYELSPTVDGPVEASGTLYLTATGSGVLDAANLPDPGDGVYQLWFHPQGGGPPMPGPSFTVNEDGLGFALIAADTDPFGSVSISREPAGGSEAPTGPMVLTGDAAGARG